MRKHILIVSAMVIITGMAVVGCGSKQETSASAGELTRETTIEEETTIKTGKKPQKQIETSVKETETTKGKEITETTEEKTTQKENPTVGGKADQPQEPATVLEKNQPEGIKLLLCIKSVTCSYHVSVKKQTLYPDVDLTL